MGRRKKGAVRPGRGTRCLICGLDCGKGGALSHHVSGKHLLTYDLYKRCFKSGDFVLDELKTDRTGDFLVHIRVFKVPKKG